MNIKLNKLNDVLTDLRSQNVKLERERDMLKSDIKKIMNDNMSKNKDSIDIQNKLDEYKTNYNTLKEETDIKFQELEKHYQEQYEQSKNNLINDVQTKKCRPILI